MSELLKKLESRLSNEFEQIDVNGLICFLLPSGVVANLVDFAEYKAVAVEYADDITKAKKNLFEDGDLFYVEEMTEEEIFAALLEEMNANS